MPKPITHAKLHAKKLGGNYKDYLEINKLMDSVKICIGDNRARSFTHNTWFIYNILPKIFGEYILNSDNKEIPTSQIGELHILEDFGFLPNPTDFLSEMEYKSWMHGAGKPDSTKKLGKEQTKKITLWKN